MTAVSLAGMARGYAQNTWSVAERLRGVPGGTTTVTVNDWGVALVNTMVLGLT